MSASAPPPTRNQRDVLAFDSAFVGNLINAAAVIIGPVLVLIVAHLWRREGRNGNGTS